VIAYLIIPKPIDEETLAEKRILDSLRIVSENAMKMGATTEDTPIEITVHIAGMEDHFLKASVIFEYDEKNEKLGTELRKRASTKYKDMLKKHMSNLSFTEITDPSERDKICNDLQHIINASLPKNMGEIRSVMFTNYITQ
jgi:flagellar basal body-associated protein FliL